MFLRSVRKTMTQRRVLQEFSECIRSSIGVIRCDEEPCLTINDNIRNTADVCRDDGAAGGGGLQEHIPQCFAARESTEDISGCVGTIHREWWQVAAEDDALLRNKFLLSRLEHTAQ